MVVELSSGMSSRYVSCVVSSVVRNHNFFLRRVRVKFLSQFSEPIDAFSCDFIEPFPCVLYHRRIFDSGSWFGIFMSVNVGGCVPLLRLRDLATIPTDHINLLVLAGARYVMDFLSLSWSGSPPYEEPVDDALHAVLLPPLWRLPPEYESVLSRRLRRLSI